MADQLQLRGGTTVEHASFTGALKEITVDTDKDVLVVHDGVTAGGHALAAEDLSNVSGSDAASKLNNQTVVFNGGAAATPSLTFNGDTNTGLYSPGADQVAISTNGTGRLFVDASGRVGIGDEAPEVSLHVASANNTPVLFENTGSADSYAFLRNNAGGAYIASRTNDISFHTTASATERLRITSDGKLGLGTSAPWTNIEVRGSNVADGVASRTFGTPPSNLHVGVSGFAQDTGGSISFGSDRDSASDYCAYGAIAARRDSALSYEYSGYLTFSTSNGTNLNERMRLTSGGRLGIGTTGPSSHNSIDRLLNIDGANGTKSGISLSEASANYFDIYFDGSNNTAHIDQSASGGLIFTSSANEAFRVDSSQRLLVGTSSARNTFFNQAGTYSPLFQIESATPTTGATMASIVAAGGNSFGGYMLLGKHRGTNGGTPTIVNDDDLIGSLSFQGGDGSEMVELSSINAYVDGTPGADDMPGRLVFSTTADGASSPTERMRISQDGRFYLSGGWYTNITTANAANVHAISNGEFYRSTSSIKYKTDVETLQDSYADAILKVRPVWYRSTCQDDNPAHSWWGFIAEEVAEVDPRLVQWKTKEITYDDNGSPVETPCDPEPEGVAYDRFVPHLLNLIKRQGEAIAELQAEVAALKAQ